MPNPEHVTLLLSSEWNGWRTRNANVTPDLTDANLAGKDLSGKDLKRADLSRADFSAAKLDGAGHWLIFFRIILPMTRPVHSQYEDFMRHVYTHGSAKTDRTGTGTLTLGGSGGKGAVMIDNVTIGGTGMVARAIPRKRTHAAAAATERPHAHTRSDIYSGAQGLVVSFAVR